MIGKYPSQKFSGCTMIMMFLNKTMSWCSGPKKTDLQLPSKLHNRPDWLPPSHNLFHTTSFGRRHRSLQMFTPLCSVHLSEDARSRRKMWPRYLHPGPQWARPAAVMLLQPLFPISAWQRAVCSSGTLQRIRSATVPPVPLLARVLFNLAWTVRGSVVLLEVIWK